MHTEERVFYTIFVNELGSNGPLHRVLIETDDKNWALEKVKYLMDHPYHKGETYDVRETSTKTITDSRYLFSQNILEEK